MVQAIITILSALWLGILTSVSPCPLATNIAAISFLAKKVNRPKAVLLAGLSYTLGRMAAYTLLGIIIVNSLISVPVIANFLQKYMNMILGPVLLVVGCFLLDLLKVNLAGFSLSDKKQKSLAAAGLKGAFALGIIFALSFCPLSAALFFGSLVPLS